MWYVEGIHKRGFIDAERVSGRVVFYWMGGKRRRKGARAWGGGWEWKIGGIRKVVAFGCDGFGCGS